MQAEIADGRRARLRQLAGAFLRLGSTAFGGPAVHIAMFEREFVRERAWLTREHFLDLLAVTNLLPGPNSTEMAIHIGYLRAGFWGALAAGVAFIAPSFFMVWLLSWLYVTYGALPQVAPLLRGIAPAVVAIIAEATWRFGRSALRGPSSLGGVWPRLALLAAAFAAAALGMHEVLVLLAAGAIGVLLSGAARARLPRPPAGLWLALGVPVFGPVYGPGLGRLLELAWFFLRTGSVLFGSGYLLISFIERDLVQTYHWLSTQQVLDAIALGQLTPGPLSTTSTFVGYLVGGDAGAVIATVAMFLPAFVVVFVCSPFIPRLRNAVLARAFLDGLTPAVVGLLAATVLRLAYGAFGTASGVTFLLSLLIALAALGVLLRWKINTAWVLLGGALAGLLLNL